MCGRYVSTPQPAARSPQDLIDLFEVNRGNSEQRVAPSWNIAPTDDVWAVLHRPERETGALEGQLRPLRWGLVPSWATNAKIGIKLINARAETVHEKPAYRRAFATRRCLLPGWLLRVAGRPGDRNREGRSRSGR
jgi:putative SOS response-associated peptidase YedK